MLFKNDNTGNAIYNMEQFLEINKDVNILNQTTWLY